MEKEFVSYSIALKLKKIGFNEECFGFYNNADSNVWIKHLVDDSIKSIYKGDIQAPLWQQVFGWFREKHNYSGEVYYYESSDFGKWHFDIEPLKPDGERYTTPVKEGFNTHQEAQEKLIEKLIEIVKNGTVKNR